MDLLNGLMEKVGLDKEKAEAVVAFLTENASKIPEWLGGSDAISGLTEKLPGGLGNMFGGGDK